MKLSVPQRVSVQMALRQAALSIDRMKLDEFNGEWDDLLLALMNTEEAIAYLKTAFGVFAPTGTERKEQ